MYKFLRNIFKSEVQVAYESGLETGVEQSRRIFDRALRDYHDHFMPQVMRRLEEEFRIKINGTSEVKSSIEFETSEQGQSCFFYEIPKLSITTLIHPENPRVAVVKFRPLAGPFEEIKSSGEL